MIALLHLYFRQQAELNPDHMKSYEHLMCHLLQKSLARYWLSPMTTLGCYLQSRNYRYDQQSPRDYLAFD